VAARAIDPAAIRVKDHIGLRIHKRETRGVIEEMIGGMIVETIAENRHHDASQGEKRLIRMCRRLVHGRGGIVGVLCGSVHLNGSVRRLHETAAISSRSRHRGRLLGDIHRREEMIARDRHHEEGQDHRLEE
jgi:hypothetical protein